MTTIAKLLIALLLCALPSLGLSAENTSPLEKPQSAPAATAPAKATEAVPQPVRIGYVDMAKISAESVQGKASRGQVQEKQKKLQAQIESKRKQLDKQKGALEAKFATLSPSQRESKAKEFQKKVEEFQKFGLNAEKELQTLQESLSNDLFSAIEQAATDYGKSKGLALVVVKRELLYLASGVDAQDSTDGVITLLNDRSKK